MTTPTRRASPGCHGVYGVTEIYYSIGANKLVNSVDMVETFVKNAAKHEGLPADRERPGCMRTAIRPPSSVFDRVGRV
ncbi:MAG: hypothetical protein ACLUOF_05070 [Ruminococcus sp.]